MSSAFDLIVIGAGPAGCRAALAASRHGVSVLLIDEAAAAGGQVYRAPAGGLALKLDEDGAKGDELRRRIAQSAITLRFGCRVWSVASGFRVDVAGHGGHEAFTAPRLIAATGAYERVVPFPGWTLPGVIGLAAATILIKSQGMLPGRRIVLAGCGPLLLLVASKVLAAGGEIAAIADLSGPADWLATLPRVLRRPRLADARSGLGRDDRQGARAGLFPPRRARRNGTGSSRARRDRPGRSFGRAGRGEHHLARGRCARGRPRPRAGSRDPAAAPRRHDLRSPARWMGAAGGRSSDGPAFPDFMPSETARASRVPSRRFLRANSPD